MTELKALRQQLSNDSTASYFADQFYSHITSNKDAENELKAVIKNGVQRYKQIDEIKERLDNNESMSQILQVVFKHFPSFAFIICNELEKRPEYYEITRPLRMAVAASSVSRKMDYKEISEAFINQIDEKESLDEMNLKATDHNKDPIYIPRLVNLDLLQLAESQPSFKSTTNPHELIEVIYYFKVIKQVFLKFYFYLIGFSQNDLVAIHINRIFSKLFISVRTNELRFWKKFKNGKKLQLQLATTIAKDLDKSRHPQLRKHIFDRVNYFNPVVQDGSLKSTVLEVRQLLMKQLAVFYELSINKLVLLLDTTLKMEGNAYVTFLLAQLMRTNNEKLFNLYDYLKEQPSDKTKVLRFTVIRYTDRLPRSKRKLMNSAKVDSASLETIYKTAGSLRQKHATKRLSDSEGNRGMTQDQVTGFLKDRLKKLYEKAKKEGALTKDQIPGYLAKFASAAEALVGPIPIGSQQLVIDDFKNTTDEILEEITSKGQLSAEEIQEVKKDINEKAEALVTPDVEERTDIVDEIGVTLTDASFEADKRKAAAELEAFFNKNIIPYGLEKKAKRVTVVDFFTFPFGDFNGPEEEDWFDFHLRYLQLAVKKSKLDKKNFIKIFNNVSQLPKIQYKKYFNIFPNDDFEETTFMAVYDLWQNKAFDRLKIS
jgi:hypothetical protein